MGDRTEGCQKKAVEEEKSKSWEQDPRGDASCGWHFTRWIKSAQWCLFVKCVLKVSECSWMSTCQRFGYRIVGEIEKKQNKALRTIFTLKKKKALPFPFLFELFSRFAYLSFSLTSSSPPSSSLLAFPPRSREQARGRASGAVSCSSPSRFYGAWIKVAFRAAIVRVIRKSYLQRVRVARAETARGMEDEARACACLQGRGVWIERRFFSWVRLMREIIPATFLSVYCEHVWIRVHIIAHFYICVCAHPHWCV